MGKRQVVTTNFLRGQQDTAVEDGLPYPGWAKFYDWILSEGGLKRRGGMVRVARAGDGEKSLEFVAASSQRIDIPVDSQVWTLGTQFTIEGLIAADAVAGTVPVLYVGSTTANLVIDTASSKLRVRVWDSADALTTVASTDDLTTATTSFQFVRNGASLTLRLNNSATAGNTGTMDASNSLRAAVGTVYIGYDGSNYYDGKIDYLRGFKIARAGHPDDLLRWPDPRCEYVLFDYDLYKDGDELVTDRSRFGNTGLCVNTPTVATTLAHQTSPGALVHHYQRKSGERRVLLVAGKSAYDVEV